jgi:hypothetical protein
VEYKNGDVWWSILVIEVTIGEPQSSVDTLPLNELCQKITVSKLCTAKRLVTRVKLDKSPR